MEALKSFFKRIPKTAWQTTGAIAILLVLTGVAFLVDEHFFPQEKPPLSSAKIQTVDTSSWSPYRDEVYGFALKLPPAWEQANVTRGAKSVATAEGQSRSYNYFHFEFPVTDAQAKDVGFVYFEVGVFSPAVWDLVKEDWQLLDVRDGAFFGGQGSEVTDAKGLEDRHAEITTILSTFSI